MIQGGLACFKDKRVLLLQGPVGPFFRRFAEDLLWEGAQVCKIDFNGGDWLFSPRKSLLFRGRPEEWPAFFEQILVERRIDVLFLFGDCRPLHRVAHEIAHRRGVDIGVFEEGYVRPDYITLERFGVNGHSNIPRDPLHHLNSPVPPVAPSLPVGKTFGAAAAWAMIYYAASSLFHPIFRHYRHHRPLHIWEGLCWLRGFWRDWRYRSTERGLDLKLQTQLSKRYFLVPLQVHNDAQIHIHSDFDSVEAFIADVIASFAKNADPDHSLVIKHHPLDRGYHDYTRLIRKKTQEHGAQGRVFYLHDQHLPTLLEHARGVIVINSTVGFSAIHHGTPVKVCGEAIYNMQGLTFQGPLDDFWTETHRHLPSPELYHRFRQYVIHHTQYNGSFYKRLEIPGSLTGVVWGDPPQPELLFSKVPQTPPQESAPRIA